MSTDIPQIVTEMWEQGLAEKARGDKETAMKHFLGYYDMLGIFLQSHNLQISDDILAQRVVEVEAEIGNFLQDPDFLATTRIPQEGIDEIRAAVGIAPAHHFQIEEECELLTGRTSVLASNKRILEVKQLILVDYRYKWNHRIRELKLRLMCQGRSEEFVYAKMSGLNVKIPLYKIVLEIWKNSGMGGDSENPLGGHENKANTTVPSIQELLENYLVRGGWLTEEEANGMLVEW